MATGAEKKSTGFAGKVTAAAERRAAIRTHLRILAADLQGQLDLENGLADPDTVIVELQFTGELARTLADSLRSAESMI